MRRMVAAQCVILVASTLLIRPVSAVGLGQLSAESAINQPLNVRVELLDLGTTALEEITVQLATAEDFARLGVEPPELLAWLQLAGLLLQLQDRVEGRGGALGRHGVTMTRSLAVA